MLYSRRIRGRAIHTGICTWEGYQGIPGEAPTVLHEPSPVERAEVGKPFFGSRQLKVAGMGGWALENEETKKWNREEPQRGAVDDRNGSKVTRSKKTHFSPSTKRTSGVTETKNGLLIPIRRTWFAVKSKR